MSSPSQEMLQPWPSVGLLDRTEIAIMGEAVQLRSETGESLKGLAQQGVPWEQIPSPGSPEGGSSQGGGWRAHGGHVRLFLLL